jgi:hypothetical protein
VKNYWSSLSDDKDVVHQMWLFPSFEFEHFADGKGHFLNSLLQSQLDVLKKFGCFVDLLFLSWLQPDLS